MGIEDTGDRLPADHDVLADNSIMSSDPWDLFEKWIEEAREIGQIEPTAMSLATTDENGNPSCRVVLMRGITRDDEGIYFYTNGDSRKSKEIIGTGKAAATFWWDRLGRQVRMEGCTISRATDEVSDRYWSQRHPGHRRGAIASNQSQVIDSRQTLVSKMKHVEETYPDDNAIPRPPNWYGWLLKPKKIEFWQQRKNRLHDRILFSIVEGGETVRLQP